MRSVAEKVRANLTGSGTEPALDIRGSWHDRAELHAAVRSIDDALARLGIGEGHRVAIIARNRFGPVAAFAALLASRRGAVLLNGAQSVESLVASPVAQNVAAWIAEPCDLASGALLDHARRVGCGLLTISGTAAAVAADAAARPFPVFADEAFVVGTSGSTGLPKAIAIADRTLARAMDEIELLNLGFGDSDVPHSARPPLIQYSPLAHIAGALTAARAMATGRGLVLLEKFSPDDWVATVKRHRPRTTGLPPTMMRMMMEADASKEDLASLVSVWSGSAPIDPAVVASFEARYGIPVLGNYGATEFCGAIATWSLDDHARYADRKRRAVGRVRPEIASVRVVDNESLPLGIGAVGILEARVERVGPQWIRTNDRASLDEDGFLYLHGRADGAINRGGFKIIPEALEQALRLCPVVREAAIVARPDARLGEVPVAFVEVHAGKEQACEQTISAFARTALPSYQVPKQIHIVSALPLTSSLKVDRSALRAMAAAAEANSAESSE